MTQTVIPKDFKEILQNVTVIAFKYWVSGCFVALAEVRGASTFFYLTQLLIFIMQGRK